MDALKDKGVRNIDMPLMPNRVYEALTTGKDIYGMPPVRVGN
jgi:carbon-monoxide dehydrogenase large subunit